MGSVKKGGNAFAVIPDPAGAYVLVELSQGQWTACDLGDWFGNLDRFRWYAAWDNSTRSFYVKAHCKKEELGVTCINMNRAILALSSGSIFADHKDHDTLNNRRSNLRPANGTRSASNRRRFLNNSSRFTGVSFLKNDRKWLSYININKQRTVLGKFDDPVAAARRRDEESRRIHGEYAVLNFPNSGTVGEAA